MNKERYYACAKQMVEPNSYRISSRRDANRAEVFYSFVPLKEISRVDR